MSKTTLATEYAILKHSVWADSGVADKNNQKRSHYNMAMRYMSIKELTHANEALAMRVVNATG